MLREAITKIIESSKTHEELVADSNQRGVKLDIEVERSSQKKYGDYTIIVKYIEERKVVKTSVGDVPMEMGTSPLLEKYKNLINEIKKSPEFEKYFKEAYFKEPIFINLILKEGYLRDQIKEILKQKEKFGSLKMARIKGSTLNLSLLTPPGP